MGGRRPPKYPHIHLNCVTPNIMGISDHLLPEYRLYGIILFQQVRDSFMTPLRYD
jgi:hypothetical protein